MTITTANPLLDAALDYATRGWPVFPVHSISCDCCTCGKPTCDCPGKCERRDDHCKSPGKHPRTHSGIDDASVDGAVLRDWWDRWPGANVGICTGPESGLLIIDLDGPEGLASWQRLIASHGPVDTMEVVTGSGGRHVIFAYPIEGEYGNRSKVLPGIDVRGARGYVVAPPSLHVSGGQYVLDRDRPPSPAPAWLLKILHQPKTEAPAPDDGQAHGAEHNDGRVELCLAAVLRIKPDEPEKDGSRRLFSWACRCVEFDLSDAQAVLVVRAAEMLRPFPKRWSDAEITKRVRDAEQKVKRGDDLQPEGQVVYRTLSEVEPEAVDWLWLGRYPRGKLGILAGIQGIGKSFLTIDMAARISRGAPWPDSLDQPNTPGSVVLLSAEDAAGDTIRPRMDAANGDSTRIVVIEGVREAGHDEPRAFDLQRDLAAVAKLIDKLGDAQMVVLDPLDAYLGERIDSHKSADVRRVLHPLADFAQRYNVAVLGVCHLNKSPGPQEAIYRVLGSVAFTAAARSAWLVAPDKANPHHRLLVPLKMNLAKAAPGLAFTIEDGKVLWIDGQVDLSAEEVLGDQEDEGGGPAMEQAVAFLKEALAEGPARATEIQKWRKQNGVSDRTLDRAKARLRVVSQRVRGVWFWSLPGQSAKGEDGDGDVGDVGVLGVVGGGE